MLPLEHYASLNVRWTSIRGSLPQESLHTLHALLLSKDDKQVRASFDLLLSLDASALCEVLQEIEGQLYVRVSQHRLLWEKCILEEIQHKKSVWYVLFRAHLFLELELRVCAYIDWGELCDIQQNKVLQKSRQCTRVPAGTFMMGAMPDDAAAEEWEKPRHQVTLTKDMWVGAYVCTQALYLWAMGRNPSNFKGSLRPVEMVSWCDAVLFCNTLSEKEGLEPCYAWPEPFENDNDWAEKVRWNRSANGYRLLTEAEWEYCAKAGTDFLYAGSNVPEEVGWCGEDYKNATHPCGEKNPNGFGLYDMSGNVWEWVWDSADSDFNWNIVGESIYTAQSRVDPEISVPSAVHVNRGGCRSHYAQYMRNSYRNSSFSALGNYFQGFRFARNCT